MEKIWGTICTNTFCTRGYYDGQRGSNGEKLYIDITGKKWSQYDVTFKPDSEN